MVGEGHRLRPLQMGVAGHDRVEVLRRPIAQLQNEREQQGFDLLCLLPQRQPQVERDLVVAAARGVQALARAADPLRELRLDKHVDVLRAGVEDERAAF